MLKIKGIVSTLLIIAFIITAVTGIFLFFGWIFFGLKRYIIVNIHEMAGIIMIFIVIFHFFLNRKLYAAGVKSWKKKK